MLLAPLTVAVAAVAASVDWNPVIVAIAATIAVFNGLLPSVVSYLLHRSQAAKIADNAVTLRTVQQQTNGIAAEHEREIADLKRQVAALQARLDAQPHWIASPVERAPPGRPPGVP